ncbi:cadmium resistance transporter [Halorubrum vacuolatum]|uniref:Cadmium resistance protein CadD, predicted permease n=1 Tax=Halorubrum vacuolatum TaxID=63740 RepID=A0A238WRY8_HALVU|nr:cadmium resistance transporter [Halorubrum vacuolatum]SNR49083.1 Cadmium resistance protein CadD, predicted permease [Halorubrum vacuolatum]
MRTVLLLATWLFIITHIDTFAVLVAFGVDEAYTTAEVVVGHYIGFTAGLVGAVILATVAGAAFRGWTFLLGVVPLALGVWGLLRRRDDEAPPVVNDEETPGGVAVVAGAGVGLSGENLAVFIPFFSGLDAVTLAAIVGFYLVAAGVLVVVALAIARRTAADLPPWVDRWLVPAMLALVGLYVLGAGLAF